jgi:DNA mismatch repair ATPase MutS
MLIDMVAQRELAEQAYSLVVLSNTLDSAARIAHDRALPPLLTGTIREDLMVHAQMRKRLVVLSTQDPFGVFEILRSMFLVRLFMLRSLVGIVERERDRLRRAVLWVGELDAFASITRLREERADASVPELVSGATTIEASALVHPALDAAVPNDLGLTGSLLITGSNASGKSTFLRTVGVNALLAQSLHTTCGRWRGPLVRVRAAMRINDDLGSGMSTYAAEVASVGGLVQHAADEASSPLLALLDEPFHGTNPAVRVPIVVAVLEFLADHGFVIAATHDLDVARLVSERFARGYFTDVGGSDFDRKLRPGIAPSTNAFALLANAGYPSAILERIGQVASPVTSVSSTVPRND